MAEEEKKQTGKKRNYKAKFNFYEIKGESVERKNKVCPKCGPAGFLAVHTDRLSCGGCGYTEKSEAPKAETPAEEEKVEGGKVEGSETPKAGALKEEKIEAKSQEPTAKSEELTDEKKD